MPRRKERENDIQKKYLRDLIVPLSKNFDTKKEEEKYVFVFVLTYNDQLNLGATLSTN